MPQNRRTTAKSGNQRFDPPLDLPYFPTGTRLTGEKARSFQKQVIAAYVERRASIRTISEATGRSYGSIQRLIPPAERRERGNRSGQELLNG